MTRCYLCDQREARYDARLDWNSGPHVLICDDCAVWERQFDSVITIRSLPVNR